MGRYGLVLTSRSGSPCRFRGIAVGYRLAHYSTFALTLSLSP
ncbi:hypothetical protein [Halalkalicoccus salilacus]